MDSNTAAADEALHTVGCVMAIFFVRVAPRRRSNQYHTAIERRQSAL